MQIQAGLVFGVIRYGYPSLIFAQVTDKQRAVVEVHGETRNADIDTSMLQSTGVAVSCPDKLYQKSHRSRRKGFGF